MCSPLLSVFRCAVLCACAMGAAPQFAFAQNGPPTGPAVVTPLQDDAQLHDVHLVGKDLAWGVGDHGVIWASNDGGKSWSLQSSGVSAPLHSVWFLNRREGWIVGGETEPFTHRTRGVVLHTSDGGDHWELIWPKSSQVAPNKSEPEEAESGGSFQFRTPPLAQDVEGLDDLPRPELVTRLPRLRRVRFFTPKLGLAAGVPDATSPGGVFRTDDGGVSWRSLAGDIGEEWLGADFANYDTGVVVGLRGETARVVGRKVDRSRRPSIGNRGLYDVALTSAQVGWLVGDGGLVLKTTNGGLVWQAPEESLPEDVRKLFDFRAVACRGADVWVAGEPGGVIWHSPDGGQSWGAQLTGQPLPITAIHFSDERCGCAVGALGLILRTSDGGVTWKVARGGNRRLALWQLHGRGSQVRLAIPVEYSGDQGFRSLVEVVGREDVGQAERLSRDFPMRLSEAIPRAGGSVGSTCWQFPLGAPGLERDFDKLLADWNRRNENRFEEVLTSHLVRQIRMWRPSVLVLDPQTDALSKLVAQLSADAVEQAADPTRWLQHQELAGLEPWRVERVFQRLPAGSKGAVQIERHRLLPHLGLSNTLATRKAEGLLFEESPSTDERAAWNVIRPAPAADSGGTIRGGFFGGMAISPGSAARRTLSLEDDANLTAIEERVRRQRNFAAISQRSITDPVMSAQLLAEIPSALRGIPAEQGAESLRALAQQYASVGKWELAELTLVELSQRYPDEPAGLAAMQQLVQWWSSGELAWRRLRPTATRQGRLAGSSESAQQAIAQAMAKLEQQSRSTGRTLFDEGDDNAPTPVETTGRVELAGNSAASSTVEESVLLDYRGKLKFWHSQAARVARELQRRAPDLAEQPAVQLPMAVVFRTQGLYLRADDLFARQAAGSRSPLWRRISQSEVWLSTRSAPPDFAATLCTRANETPTLDGLLSDVCWQQAEELALTQSGAAGKAAAKTMVFVCYDDEYLYWAGSVPRDPGVRSDRPTGKGRKHDGAGDEFDRVTLSLDVDRDYHTSYQLTIDQRGETSDRCLQDAGWNPRWIVAIDADETHWRFEAAIPWSELTPLLPGPDTAWALGCVRTIPAVGVASWCHPATPTPRPECFGLLRFE